MGIAEAASWSIISSDCCPEQADNIKKSDKQYRIDPRPNDLLITDLVFSILIFPPLYFRS